VIWLLVRPHRQRGGYSLPGLPAQVLVPVLSLLLLYDFDLDVPAPEAPGFAYDPRSVLSLLLRLAYVSAGSLLSGIGPGLYISGQASARQIPDQRGSRSEPPTEVPTCLPRGRRQQDRPALGIARPGWLK